MTKKILMLALIAVAGGAFAAQPASTTKAAPAKTATQKKAEPPKETERMVPYGELGQYINKRVIVHSTLGTTRSGTLTHYTQSQIDIALDGTGAQLTFLHDAIKTVSVPVEPEPAADATPPKKS